MNPPIICFLLLVLSPLLANADGLALLEDALSVPDGFTVSIYAREPLVRNPCAMAFDARGRLFVGQGPQYRNPKPDSPTDRVTLLIDEDNDGVADKAETFAEGFNSIQGLAWYGDQLWIANAPDLTVVRDTNGDDRADEYRRIYGGLGNLEHGLHGLVFAPDGRLYMSKGNSKGYLQAKSPERFLAPAPFADLWGVEPPADTPDAPESEVFTRETYKHGYHTPSDDWGTEGGVLRCRPDGTELEVFARGMRNLWDMSFDADFNWIGTDQDQDGGDRILNPFLGSHFGWGHPWSPHWTGENHLPSTPISGPVFHGSGTGVVSCGSDRFPESYQDAFFCADWLNRSIFLYRPKWDGAIMRNMATPEVFAKAPRGRSMGSSKGLLFDPTDMAFGPDGALWVLSWGHGYGSSLKGGKQFDEGRVYRLCYGQPVHVKTHSKHSKPYSDWTTQELVEDLRHNTLPVRRTNAQTELVRRGRAVSARLMAELRQPKLPRGAATWLIGTLAQIPHDPAIDELLIQTAAIPGRNRIQALRAIGRRARQFKRPLPIAVRRALKAEQPRIRFAAVQAIHECRDGEFAADLWELVSAEQDRTTFFAARTALGLIQKPAQLREKLTNGAVGQRKAALLTLLEQAALNGDDVLPLRLDSDPVIAFVASSFISKVGTSESPVLSIEPQEATIPRGTPVRIVTGSIPDGLHVRYSLDGAEPTDTTGRKYSGPFRLERNVTLSASLFKGRERMGPVLRKKYTVTTGDLPVGGRASVASSVFPIELDMTMVKNARPYKSSILRRGERAYANRNYVWTNLPDGFAGHTFIQSRNGDSDVGSTGDEFLSFSLSEAAEVYIAHDQRIKQKPYWLSPFKSTGLTAATGDTTYDLFIKRFPAGVVTLGGNTRDGNPSARSQYVCIVKPAPLQNREVATTIDESLKKMPSADFRRGARLFFNQASCAKCHRLGERGNALAPNLTNMGTRAAPKTIAQSILKPSAVILEGFHSVVIVTDEGRTFSGFIKQESGLNVELVQADGKVVTIPRATIEGRRRQQVSVMPEGLAKQLSPQQVADLIRFITDAGKDPMQLSSLSVPSDPQSSNASRPQVAQKTKPLSTTTPITIRDNGKALVIRCGDNELATYYYQHDKVLRPFFAQLKAPSGTQVTRNFPPEKEDTKDHADMHPGLWLAFGDISGEDFWRNKGRIVHKQFLRKPTGGPGHGSFSHRKVYQRADGQTVCYEDFRCVIRALKEGYLIEWDSTFSGPTGGEFYFGDQEEMGLGLRVATEIAEVEGGHITDSENRQGAKKIWSQSSKWCDYSGVIGGESLGMTILCHPDNFRESWMHARNYGLIAANPFGRKAMKKGPSSRRVVKADDTLQLRYGILLHGPKPNLNSIYRQYVKRVGH